MELEPKHVSAYSPDLKAKLSKKGIFNLDLEYPNEYTDRIGIITNVNIDFSTKQVSGILKITDNYSFDFESLDELDIYLRPLSDLTKEIEHNGETFVPLIVLTYDFIPSEYRSFISILSTDRANYYEVGVVGDNHKFIHEFKKNIARVEFCDVQKLLEWKFDIFSLIQNGLAEPVTETFNPYK